MPGGSEITMREFGFYYIFLKATENGFLLCDHSLIGSLAITVSHGILGSPAPDRLMAETLNLYAAPSKTSLTAYVVSVDSKVDPVMNHHGWRSFFNMWCWHTDNAPAIGPFWFTRLQ